MSKDRHAENTHKTHDITIEHTQTKNTEPICQVGSTNEQAQLLSQTRDTFVSDKQDFFSHV